MTFYIRYPIYICPIKKTKTLTTMETQFKQNLALVAFAVFALAIAFSLASCGVIDLY